MNTTAHTFMKLTPFKSDGKNDGCHIGKADNLSLKYTNPSMPVPGKEEIDRMNIYIENQ